MLSLVYNNINIELMRVYYKVVLFLSVLVVSIFTSCKVQYSFTGGTLSPEMKTFSVSYFENRAPLVNPVLSKQFTEALKEKFRSQTNLDEIINGDGDLNFEGEIVNYRTSATDVQKDEMAATNRLTITIRVSFINLKDEELDFDTSFTDYEDYDSNKSLDQVEQDLVDKILVKIIDKIYNKSVVNW